MRLGGRRLEPSEDLEAILLQGSVLMAEAIAALAQSSSLSRTAEPLIKAIEAIPGAGRIAMFLSQTSDQKYVCVAAPSFSSALVERLQHELPALLISGPETHCRPFEHVFDAELLRIFPLSVQNEWPKTIFVTVRDPVDPPVSKVFDQFFDQFTQMASIVVEDRRLRTRIIEQSSLLDAIVAAAPDAIIRMDRYGIVLDYLGKSEEFFGFSAEEIVGRPASLLMSSPAAELHDGYVERFLSTGERRLKNFARRLEARRKDGTLFPVEIALGEVSGRETAEFVAIIRDISRRVSLEKDTALLQEVMDSASRQNALAELATVLAHELNQPLTAIANYADAIELRAARLDSAEKDKLVELAQLAGDQARFGGEIIRQTRQLVNVGTSTPTLGDFHDVIASTVRLVTAMPGASGIDVQLLQHDGDGRAKFDHVGIQQILINLASNALRALADQPDGKLSIESICEEETARLIVADNGPGIPDADKPRLFDRFFHRSMDGMGLGLAVVKRIVDAHGGTIDVRDNPGGGVIFEVNLPRNIDSIAPSETRD